MFLWKETNNNHRSKQSGCHANFVSGPLAARSPRGSLRCALTLTEQFSNKSSALLIHMGLLQSYQTMDCHIISLFKMLFCSLWMFCINFIIKNISIRQYLAWLLSFWHPLWFCTHDLVPNPGFCLEFQKASYLKLINHSSALHLWVDYDDC